jgi:hypothetical protein
VLCTYELYWGRWSSATSLQQRSWGSKTIVLDLRTSDGYHRIESNVHYFRRSTFFTLIMMEISMCWCWRTNSYQWSSTYLSFLTAVLNVCMYCISYWLNNGDFINYTTVECKYSFISLLLPPHDYMLSSYICLILPCKLQYYTSLPSRMSYTLKNII